MDVLDRGEMMIVVVWCLVGFVVVGVFDGVF